MVDLDRMRADYVLVRRWWRDADGWTADELEEADRGVRAAVDGEDAGLLACWAGWLAVEAEHIRRLESMVRSAEERMRAAAAAERDDKMGGSR